MIEKQFSTIYFTLFLLFPVTTIAQTCIVLIRTDTAIFIGADSRRTSFLSNGQLKYDTVCKIKRNAPIYFSNAGLDIEKAYEIASTCCRKNASLLGIANEYKKLRLPRIAHYIDSAKAFPLYEQIFPRLQHFATVFYSFKNNIPEAVLVEITLTNKINDPTTLKDSIIYFGANQGLINIFTLGEHDAVEPLLTAELFSKLGFANALYNLVKAQCRSTPSTVSEPIEIFEINNKGAHWIRNPIGCKLNLSKSL